MNIFFLQRPCQVCVHFKGWRWRSSKLMSLLRQVGWLPLWLWVQMTTDDLFLLMWLFAGFNEVKSWTHLEYILVVMLTTGSYTGVPYWAPILTQVLFVICNCLCLAPMIYKWLQEFYFVNFIQHSTTNCRIQLPV